MALGGLGPPGQGKTGFLGKDEQHLFQSVRCYGTIIPMCQNAYKNVLPRDDLWSSVDLQLQLTGASRNKLHG